MDKFRPAAPVTEIAKVRSRVSSQVVYFEQKIKDIESKIEDRNISDDLRSQIVKLNEIINRGGFPVYAPVPTNLQTLGFYQELEGRVKAFNALYPQIIKSIDDPASYVDAEDDDKILPEAHSGNDSSQLDAYVLAEAVEVQDGAQVLPPMQEKWDAEPIQQYEDVDVQDVPNPTKVELYDSAIQTDDVKEVPTFSGDKTRLLDLFSTIRDIIANYSMIKNLDKQMLEHQSKPSPSRVAKSSASIVESMSRAQYSMKSLLSELEGRLEEYKDLVEQQIKLLGSDVQLLEVSSTYDKDDSSQ